MPSIPIQFQLSFDRFSNTFIGPIFSFVPLDHQEQHFFLWFYGSQLSFATVHILRKHSLKTHDKKLSCEECPEFFSKKSELNSHMKEHTELIYSCDLCTLKFSQQVNLQNHKFLIHTGEMPLMLMHDEPCSNCSRRSVLLTLKSLIETELLGIPDC